MGGLEPTHDLQVMTERFLLQLHKSAIGAQLPRTVGICSITAGKIPTRKLQVSNEGPISLVKYRLFVTGRCEHTLLLQLPSVDATIPHYLCTTGRSRAIPQQNP